MKKYLLEKYWKGAAILVLLYVVGRLTGDTHDGAMMTTVCIFMLGWFFHLLIAGSRNHRKLVVGVGGLFLLLRLLWYVVSLQPLRHWLLRLRYAGLRPDYYPWLALYGNLLDTHVMQHKFSAAVARDKTPVVRAALWRLLARGAVRLDTGADGKPGLTLGQWTDAPSNGLDQDFERTVYKFLADSAGTDGRLVPREVERAMNLYEQENTTPVSSDKNQYDFADLLNTGISLKAYTRRDIKNIFGMKRMLSDLPDSLGNLNTTQKPELQRVWPEYMAYAYLFGKERRVLNSLARMLPAEPLLSQLAGSGPHRRELSRMMDAVSHATPAVEDIVAARMGRLPIAWHVDEIYDI